VRAAVVALAFVLCAVSCDGTSNANDVHSASAVQSAFRDAGIDLRRLPTHSAQTAMGVLPACKTRFVAVDAKGVLSIVVCDDAKAVVGLRMGVDTREWRSENVLVTYNGTDSARARQIESALSRLS
jgi:hypothetical protein